MTQRPDTSGPLHLFVGIVIAACFVAFFVGAPIFIWQWAAETEAARHSAASVGAPDV